MPAVGVVGRLPPEHSAKNTARIARTIDNVSICSDFVRAVFLPDIDGQWAVTDRHDKYLPRIDRQISPRFAGLSPR